MKSRPIFAILILVIDIFKRQKAVGVQKMIIDKNGRLFGKVSIIDVLIIALILLAGAFFAARLFTSQANPIGAGGSLDELEIKFYSEEVNNFVVDAIKEGDAAKEYAQYANFGTVVKVEKADSITWVGDMNGIIGPSSKDGNYSSITVTTRARGKINAVGFELDGTSYFVGKTVIMQFGVAGFQGRISGVEKVSDITNANAGSPAGVANAGAAGGSVGAADKNSEGTEDAGAF